MKRTTFIILFLTILINGYSSAQGGLKTDFRKVIKQSFCSTDLNPNNKLESDKIQISFTKALNEFENRDYSKEYTTLIDSLFRCLFKNSSCKYYDSPDTMRMKMSRALCYATIGLKASYSRAFTFIANSKLSTIESLDNPDIEILENQYLNK